MCGNFRFGSSRFRMFRNLCRCPRRRGFPVIIRDANNKVNGKSFMEMFCLDLCGPLRVDADCSEEELAAFCGDAERFLIR